MAAGYVLGTALLKTGVDLTGLTSGLRNAESKIGKVAKGISAAGRTMIGLGAPLAAVGAASFKVAVDFDKSMRNVNSIAGLTEEQFQELSKEVVDFSLTTRASTKDVAESLYNVVAAGYSLEKGIGGTAEAMTIMQKASSAAGAGLASTADTSKVLIAALRSYNLTAEDADHVTDLFLRTVQEGLTTLPELASSLGMVLPIASQTGVSLEELGFALAQATRGGLDTAKATNYLRQMITSFIDPSDEMGDALEKMGFTSGVAAIKALGLAGVMRGLKEQGLDNAEAMRELFPRVQGMTVAMSLMSNEAFMGGERFQQFTDAIDGTREAMRAEQYESLAGQMARLKSVVETFALDIGMKFIPPLVKLIKDIVPKLRNLFEEVDTKTIAWAAGIGVLSVAIGTGLIVVSKLIVAAQTVIGVMKAIASAKVIGAVIASMKLQVASTVMLTKVTALYGTTTQAASVAVTGLWAAFGPLIVALGGVAAAIGLVIVAHKLHKDIQERQIEVTDAWTQFLEKQVAEEKNAVEIAEEYVRKQREIEEIHERGGLVADIFVDKQKALNAETGKLSDTLAGATDSYEDYIEAAKVAGFVTEAEAEAAREAGQANIKYAGVMGDVTGIAGDYSEAALSGADATGEFKVAMTEAEFSAQKLIEAQLELDAALADGSITTEEHRHQMELWNPEIRRARQYTEALEGSTDELADSTSELADAAEDAVERIETVYERQANALRNDSRAYKEFLETATETGQTLEERYSEFLEVQETRRGEALEKFHEDLEQSAEAEEEHLKRIEKAAKEHQQAIEQFWEGTRSGLSSVLGSMEDEIESHQKSVEDMEQEHRSKIAAISGVNVKLRAERNANKQLTDERQDVLDDLEQLETRHQERLQIRLAQGHEGATESQQATYEVRKVNLELALGDLDGKYDTYYSEQLGNLTTTNAEALRLESVRYAEEKAKLEAAHAEKIAMLKQHTADVLVQRTQELLLMGEISQAQADQIVGALASVVGIGVDSSALAVNEILGMYADVVAGGVTTEAQLATAISNMDATIQELEETEKARQDTLAEQHEKRQVLLDEEQERLAARKLEKAEALAEEMAGEDALATQEGEKETAEVIRHLAKLERIALEDETASAARADAITGMTELDAGDVLHTTAVETGAARRMSAYDREIETIRGLGGAIDALPSEKIITITAIYDAPPELMPQSPILGIQKMLESAVSFAARNPIGVNAGISGGLGAGGTVNQSSTSNQFGQNTINVYGGAAAAILVEEQRRRERAAFVGMM